MRAIVDLFDTVFSSMRFLFLLFFGGIMLLGLLFTAGATFVAPAAVDSIGARVERMGNEAIDAGLEAERNRQLGREGWGYEAPSSYEGRDYNGSGELQGGWGTED